MQRCVVVGAAKIVDYKRAISFFMEDDFFIFCDGGLAHCKNLCVEPDLIIGDFDSFEKPAINNVETITLPKEKNDTDTFFAVKEALRRGFKDFLLLGVIGERFDHSIVNASALFYLFKNKARACIVDDYSVMKIVGKEKTFIDTRCSYFSVLNIFGVAKGVFIKGSKYPLENEKLTPEYMYALSNEVLPDENPFVYVKHGNVLLVEVM
ncbi:thiamine diphosphokinase [Treponema pectinovorum]|uniref:thiamine diphosphokinase n=1 Tax=Treponema pectinovorum TaxID=164 RepID=UPI0011CBDAE6|nr:thiamine diphosphokinase [Treponema pectinovorum]